MTELTYRGRAMTADPVNMRLLDVAAALNAGRVVIVVLEPGDATRYDLILAPVISDMFADINVVEVIAATRTTGAGGDFRGGALLPNAESADSDYLDEEYYRLAGHNHWTRELFRWWFLKLWEAINA